MTPSATGSQIDVGADLAVEVYAVIYSPLQPSERTQDPVHSFVVMVAKPGRALPPDLLRSLDRRDHPDVAFFAEDHTIWQSESGTVAYAGWQGATDVFAIGSHWQVSERRLTAFTGNLWPKGKMWHQDETWARQLEHHLDEAKGVDPTAGLGGMFTIVSLDRQGTGSIRADGSAMALLYRSESEDLVAYSSRAALAARATTKTGAEPRRDQWAVGWLSIMGYVVGDSTGFTGTSVLPAGSYVQLDPRYGSRVRSEPTPWLADMPSELDEVVAEVRNDLAASVQSTSQLPARKRQADLTGGKDSRLVLALMVQEGITDRFTFRTIGGAGAPDVQVSEVLAGSFGLAHETIAPTPMDTTVFGARLGAHVFQTSGMLTAWDLQGGTGIARTPTISGLYGESLRTNYSSFPESATRAEVIDRFLRSARLRSRSERLDRARAKGDGRDPSLLTPEARRYYTQVLTEELVERVDDAGSTPLDRIDSFYLRHRRRRWSGTMEELVASGRVYPLLSATGAQAAFSLGPSARRHELLHFEVMRSACPELVALPFANHGWHKEVYDHRPDSLSYTAKPVTLTNPEAARWQIDRLEANREIVEMFLLESPPDELFEIFDRDALTRAIRAPAQNDSVGAQQIYGALTAAVWLGRDEVSVRAGDPSPPPVSAIRPRGQRVRVAVDEPASRPSVLQRARDLIVSPAPLRQRLARIERVAARRVRGFLAKRR